MRRLNAWLAALGTAGVLGLGILLACAVFFASVLRPAARELAARQLAVEQLRTRTPGEPVEPEGRAGELRRFYGLFPPIEQLADQLETLYGLARGARLELARGEYRLEKHGEALWSYRVTLPLRGTYAQIRGFVGAVLVTMPSASLDALRFERKRIGDERLEAQLRLTLHFQPHDDSETR